MKADYVKTSELGGWLIDDDNDKIIVDEKGNFSLYIPLSMLIGFAESYKNVI